MNSHARLLSAVVDLSTRAGKKILEVYDTDFAVTRKDDDTPLTTADMAAHNIIVEGLNTLTPDMPALSEESDDVPYATRRTWRTYWLIDPLDGTREFIKRNGEFTVNIALIEDGQPILGVVYVPVSNTIYAGARDQGAWKQQNSAAPTPIHVRDFCAAQPIVAGSRSYHGDSLQHFLAKLGKHKLLTVGSSLKICLVAEGVADVYPRFGLTSEWDTAAAQAVIEAAGGCLMTLGMQSIRYNAKASLLNPEFVAVGDREHDWASLLAG